MQILQGRNATSDLPMSNAARKQLSIQPEIVRNTDKHPVLPTHVLHVGQQVMYQDSASKHWYLAVIDSLCAEPRIYKITTRDGIVYRKTQSHLMSFTPHNKNLQSNQCVITNGTIYPYVASKGWTQEEVTSEQSNASTKKPDLKGTLTPQSSLIFK